MLHKLAPELFSKTPEVKIILETAHDKTDDSVRNLFALGVSHFISKPLRFDNLKEMVNTVKTEFELDESLGMETDFDKMQRSSNCCPSSKCYKNCSNLWISCRSSFIII